MASIRKRGSSYHVQVRLKGYEPVTASFARLDDAKKWISKTETELRAGKYFGQSKRRTFAELLDEYQTEAKSLKYLSYWRGVFGSQLLQDLTVDRINKQIKKLLSEDTSRFEKKAEGQLPTESNDRKRSKRNGATVNRYIAALSACLSHGVKLEWIERNPCFRVNKQQENDGRVRFLTDDERPKLLAACKNNQDLYLAVLLSLTTGARQAEVMGLRYAQIDFKRKVITLEKTKNGDKRALALVGEAYDLLVNRSKVRSLNDDRVFPPTDMAKKAKYISLRKPWEQALSEAGIKDFKWHDLRHTAASYLAMSGVSLVEIAKVLGHRTLSMVLRYAHLCDDHVVSTGEKLAKRLGV